SPACGPQAPAPREPAAIQPSERSAEQGRAPAPQHALALARAYPGDARVVRDRMLRDVRTLLRQTVRDVAEGLVRGHRPVLLHPDVDSVAARRQAGGGPDEAGARRVLLRDRPDP